MGVELEVGTAGPVGETVGDATALGSDEGPGCSVDTAGGIALGVLGLGSAGTCAELSVGAPSPLESGLNAESALVGAVQLSAVSESSSFQ